MHILSGWFAAVALSAGLGATAGAPIDTRHLTVSAVPPAGAAGPGARVSLVLEVRPKAAMHVYAPQQQGYIPISLTLQPETAITARAPQFPTPEARRMEALDEIQSVYSQPFRIVQEVTLTGSPARLAEARAAGGVTIRATLRYQACDDSICYMPVNVPVAWTIALKPAAR